MRSKDFDNDGTSECLGIAVSNITILKSTTFMEGSNLIPDTFLKK